MLPFVIDDAEIERRFNSHAPRDAAELQAHDDVRASIKTFAFALVDLPEGRDKSLAFTALEEVSFRAHAAIAREGR